MSPVKQKSSLQQAAPLDHKILETADKLHSAAIHLLRRLRVRDRESGVGPAQLSALSVLVFGGSRSLGELAEAEQVRPPTMSRIVSGLQRAGLIKRHATEDGRRVRLEATAKGTKILWEGRRRRVESLASALASLGELEAARLRELVELLSEIVRKI
jgi:DNA-binding MarR family transcriptional regulator